MSAIEEATAALRKSTYAIAVTGAGISVESGIPDFRSAGGIWEKYPPEDFATIHAFMRDPDKVWRMWYELGASMLNVAPNPAHAALAKLEHTGLLMGVVTQNIDNLHQAAGSRKVIEYHGNAKRVVCISCGRKAPMVFGPVADAAPRCDCGGVQKPDVVLFGELIPVDAMREADALAQAADLVLIVGTSAQVYPAAGMPGLAKSRGALIVECNTERTEFTDGITDIFLQGRAGELLPQLAAAVAAG